MEGPSLSKSSIATAQTAASASLADWQVLVVEDDYFLAEDLSQAIAQCGARVIGPVPTRDEALGLLASGHRVDAAVLDINLRGESSFAVADALAARGIPFVFATGYGRETVAPSHQNVPHWQKPYEASELARFLLGPDGGQNGQQNGAQPGD